MNFTTLTFYAQDNSFFAYGEDAAILTTFFNIYLSSKEGILTARFERCKLPYYLPVLLRYGYNANIEKFA